MGVNDLGINADGSYWTSLSMRDHTVISDIMRKITEPSPNATHGYAMPSRTSLGPDVLRGIQIADKLLMKDRLFIDPNDDPNRANITHSSNPTTWSDAPYGAKWGGAAPTPSYGTASATTASHVTSTGGWLPGGGSSIPPMPPATGHRGGDWTAGWRNNAIDPTATKGTMFEGWGRPSGPSASDSLFFPHRGTSGATATPPNPWNDSYGGAGSYNPSIMPTVSRPKTPFGYISMLGVSPDAMRQLSYTPTPIKFSSLIRTDAGLDAYQMNDYRRTYDRTRMSLPASDVAMFGGASNGMIQPVEMYQMHRGLRERTTMLVRIKRLREALGHPTEDLSSLSDGQLRIHQQELQAEIGMKRNADFYNCLLTAGGGALSNSFNGEFGIGLIDRFINLETLPRKINALKNTAWWQFTLEEASGGGMFEKHPSWLLGAMLGLTVLDAGQEGISSIRRKKQAPPSTASPTEQGRTGRDTTLSRIAGKYSGLFEGADAEDDELDDEPDGDLVEETSYDDPPI